MTDLLPAWPVLTAFLAASLVLAVTPGPGVFYILARSAAQGRASGMASVAGVAFGNLGNAIGASLGLAALFAMSSTVFLVVKYVGAAYLVFLGIKAVSAGRSSPVLPGPPRVSRLRVFREGFIVALLNPKTALFFAAFLPQFMGPQSASISRSVALGALFVCVAALTDSLYALAGGFLAHKLEAAHGARKFGGYLGGMAFIGLGLFTALTGTRARG